jgi:predicted CXXCH cytochrome family protein
MFVKLFRRFAAPLAVAALLAAAVAVVPTVVSVAAGEPKVLFPPDFFLTSETEQKVLVYDPSGAEKLDASVNFRRIPGALEGGPFKKGTLTLAPGPNFIEVGGARVRLYCLPGAPMERFTLENKKNPAEPFVFRTVKLHPALDDGCESCHEVKDGELKSKDQKEACYACHSDHSKPEKEGDAVFVHTPVAAGECTSCHDPHFGTRPKLMKSDKGCYECHDRFPAEGTVHKPVALDECLSCHRPHSAPGRKQTVRPGNALCSSCHEMPHTLHRSPEVRPGKQGSVSVPEDFPLDNSMGVTMLSCTGCHLPHQSAERRLFKVPQGDLCKICHRM